MKFRERDAGEIPPQELARIDACWTVGSILSLADTFRGHAFHIGRFVPLALDGGEPGRVALALGTIAVMLNTGFGGSRRAHAETLFQQASELADRTGQAYVRGMIVSFRACAALLSGQWKRSFDLTEKANNIFRNECTGVAWELGVTCHYRFSVLFAMGEWKRCAEEIPPLLRKAPNAAICSPPPVCKFTPRNSTLLPTIPIGTPDGRGSDATLLGAWVSSATLSFPACRDRSVALCGRIRACLEASERALAGVGRIAAAANPGDPHHHASRACPLCSGRSPGFLSGHRRPSCCAPRNATLGSSKEKRSRMRPQVPS